ncbi:RidA family protein [Pigmentiphaga litoralis]|uniref:RidA family protein n=1 Tax=Pigmentiphaga litoralis TaxID=516702 RepID=UPI0016775F45|nr:RidA family protein [Pigmentiphaga litoralis]
MSRLVVARLFCTSPEGAAGMNQAWEESFKGEVPPARTSVIVAGLPLGAEVEIEFQLVVAQAT